MGDSLCVLILQSFASIRACAMIASKPSAYACLLCKFKMPNEECNCFKWEIFQVLVFCQNVIVVKKRFVFSKRFIMQFCSGLL